MVKHGKTTPFPLLRLRFTDWSNPVSIRTSGFGLGSHVPAKLSQSRALVATVDLKIIQIGINSSIHHHPHHNSPSPSESSPII
jgi:hypothetical protein